MNEIERPIGLMAFVAFLAIYLGLTWLAILVGIGAFFVLLSTVNFHRPEPVSQAAPAKQEEILSPVIVQEVGESPYLYPPDFRLKIKPNWNANDMWEDAGWGIGMLARSLLHLGRGSKLKRQ